VPPRQEKRKNASGPPAYNVSRLARFASPDPLSGSVANPQSLNRYAYVQNSPTQLVDPTGMCTDPIDGTRSRGACSPDRDNTVHFQSDFSCQEDGAYVPCVFVFAWLSSGAAVQCPTNPCSGYNSQGQWLRFTPTADGCAGYLPMSSPPGASVCDLANARSMVTNAQSGTPIKPSDLTGQAANSYNLLLTLGVSPENITIYQTGDRSFSAVLTDAGFDQLQNAAINLGFWDATLHYPYSDGGRDTNPQNSLHFVWMNQNYTDYFGGTGVYMQFHVDGYNPAEGQFWRHWGCDVFHFCGSH
jgi:hypothetical protein